MSLKTQTSIDSSCPFIVRILFVNLFEHIKPWWSSFLVYGIKESGTCDKFSAWIRIDTILDKLWSFIQALSSLFWMLIIRQLRYCRNKPWTFIRISPRLLFWGCKNSFFYLNIYWLSWFFNGFCLWHRCFVCFILRQWE